MPTRPLFARTLALLLFAAVATASLIPLWREAGWPSNHTGQAFAFITLIYARHFSWLDVMPLWSSVDVSGFGSPMPALYHKLFFMVAGPLALATGSLKAADLLTVALLLMIGATGMYRILRTLGASRMAATAAGCCLITANYTVTNWLVRGALAEFCGAMLVPWVLFYVARAITLRRLPIGLGITLGLLWLSHSVLAFYMAVLLAITFVLLAVGRLAPWSALSPRTAWPSLLCFACVVGPFLIPMTMIGRAYDMSRILTPPYRPTDQFVPALSYVWDARWRFGQTATGLTVQLDSAMLALLCAGLVALRRGTARWGLLQPALPFVTLAALGLLLQMPLAAPFYKWFPGAAFIQFPWRLLALITPALVVSAVYLADRAIPAWGSGVALGAATIWMIVTCGAFVPMKYARIQVDGFSLAGVTSSGFREYEPRVALPVAEIQANLSSRWLEAGCAYLNLDADSEVATVRFHTVCSRATVLPLPLYASSFHAVSTSTASHADACLPVTAFPGVCGAVIPAGESVVLVTMPTLTALVAGIQR